MNTTLLFVVAGCLLGVVQLAVGVGIGMWLRRPKAKSRDTDLRRARSLALELHGLTQRVGGHVAEHRARFEAADARLRDAPTGKHLATTDLVVGVVSEVLSANRQLQEELAAAERQIADQAGEIESHLTTSLTDPLTQLPNRRAFDDQLAGRLQDYRKHSTPFSLLMVDVDHFKQINDTFGHPVGDEVLVSMGKALRAALRKHDFVARIGGEEFAIIFPYTTLEEAQRAATKACEGVAALACEYEFLSQPVTASGGLASIHPGEDLDSLVRRADDALYMAKHNGRDRTYMHDGNGCGPLRVEVASGEPRWKSPELVAICETVQATEPSSEPIAGACDDLRTAMLEAVGQDDK